MLRFFSHLLWIGLSHSLLVSVVDFGKFFRGTAENKQKIQILVLLFAIALGYLVSTFFLDILAMSRSLVHQINP